MLWLLCIFRKTEELDSCFKIRTLLPNVAKAIVKHFFIAVFCVLISQIAESVFSPRGQQDILL